MLKKIISASLVVAVLASIGAYASPSTLSVENDGFAGKFNPSSSTEKRIGVLVLGGSEGGLPERLAKPIIDAGFPTLALAYFNYEGLPLELENIPLEYFNKAKLWLQSQTNVNSEKIIIVGWSKGAELALLLASRDADINKVVAIAPSSVAWAGILRDWTKVPSSSWTEQGKGLTHVAFKPSGQVNGLLDLYTQSLENRSDNGKADIPVEKIAGNVVLMTGEDDEIWPSSRMAMSICERINANQNGTCEHLNFSGLDHLLDYKFIDKSEVMNKTFIRKLDDVHE
jgi:dienelactone hydrolase